MTNSPIKYCTLCGLDVNKGHTQSRQGGTTQEVVINATDEYSGYEDGGYKRGYHFNLDMCFDCFIEKLIPWIEGQGASIQRTKYEYKTHDSTYDHKRPHFWS